MERTAGIFCVRKPGEPQVHMIMKGLIQRISELFDIIVEFPESTPALEDLKDCLKHTDQHTQLIASLRKR